MVGRSGFGHGELQTLGTPFPFQDFCGSQTVIHSICAVCVLPFPSHGGGDLDSSANNTRKYPLLSKPTDTPARYDEMGLSDRRLETRPRCLLFQLVGYFVLEHLLYAYEREFLRSMATFGHA